MLLNPYFLNHKQLNNSIIKPSPAALSKKIDETTIKQAVKNFDYHKTQELLAKKPELINTKDGEYSLLHIAVHNHDIETTQLLIQKRIDVNLKSDGFLTALHIAASTGYIDIIILLIESGANITIKNHLGETALLIASKEGKTNAVRFLLSCGADKEAKNAMGRTALHLAALNHHADVTEVLLNAQVDIDVKDMDNNTPLHLTVLQHDFSLRERKIAAINTIETLLTKGAKKNLRNKIHKIPFDYLDSEQNYRNLEKIKSLLREEDAVKMSEIDRESKITKNTWVLHLARKANRGNIYHVFLILEGMRAEDSYFTFYAEFVTPDLKTGIILTEEVNGNSTAKLLQKITSTNLKGVNLAAKTWLINKELAEQLLASVIDEQGLIKSGKKEILYQALGDQVIAVSPLTTELMTGNQNNNSELSPVGHSCFSWGREKINNLGDRSIKVSYLYTDWIASSPMYHLPFLAENVTPFWTKTRVAALAATSMLAGAAAVISIKAKL